MATGAVFLGDGTAALQWLVGGGGIGYAFTADVKRTWLRYFVPLSGLGPANASHVWS
jgi:hypothetical protein